MKLSCEIIQDLLPLYADNVCSPDSRNAVDEHLTQCPACRRNLQTIRQPDIAAGLGLRSEPEPVIRERVMKNGFRKLRRRWLLSVLSIFLVFPVLLLGLMGIHEYRGEGIAFTNLDEIFIARRFMSLIEDQHFDEAAELLDFESKYQNIQEVLNRQPEDYLPSFELYTVNETSWIALRGLWETYPIHNLCEKEDSVRFWFYLVLNNIENILIPESAWTQIRQFTEDTPQYFEAQESYFPIDTPWGIFYTGRIYGEELMEEEEITAECLLRLMDFIPYEIYLAAQESLEQEAFASYRRNQDYYAFAADMTQEEFVQNTKCRFVQALEACYSNGITIQNSHFAEAYQTEQEWIIGISAIQRQSTGQSFQITYDFRIQNGKLCIISSSRPTELSDDPVFDAFRLANP